MILVTGGTGNLGKKIIEQLSQSIVKNKLTISVRDLNKAQDLISQGLSVIEADYNDLDSLQKAMRGVNTLFFVSSDAPAALRMQQHQQVVDVAKESGVQHIIYTSFIDVAINSPFIFSHIHAKTEQCIKESGIPYTFLRNNLYSDLLSLVKLNDQGQFSLPAGNGKVAFISRNDIALFAAKVLVQDEQHHNKVYELTGSCSYSYNEIAQLLSQKLHKTVSYVPGTAEGFIQKLVKVGLPEAFAKSIAGMYLAISDKQFGYEHISKDFENIMGVPAKNAQQFLLNLE